MLSKWYVHVRVRLGNTVKWLRLNVFGMGKYESVIIDKAVFQKVKKEPLFIASIQLGRIANAVRSSQRTVMRIVDWSRLTDTKDRIEQLFILASYTYEGIKEFFRREPDLSILQVWTEKKAEIEKLRKERDGRGSRYWQVIHDIRNDVSFHFLKKTIEEHIDEYEPKDKVNFLIGKTELEKDILYILGDDIVMQYVFGREFHDWACRAKA